MRKGVMTVSEVLGLVLALVGVLILIYFGVRVSNSYIDQDRSNSQNFINSLSAKIENMNDGVGNPLVVKGVYEWVLVAWNKDDSTAVGSENVSLDKKPQKCFDKNCLCLCQSIELCQETGYCRYFDRDIKVLSKFNYSYVKETNFGTIPTFAEVSLNLDSECIHQTPQLMEIFVDKNSTNILVLYDYGNLSRSYTINEENDERILDILDGKEFNGKPFSSKPLEEELYIEALRNRCK